MAHSKSDDNRDKAEVEQYWNATYCILAAREFPGIMAPIEERLLARLDAAVDEAELSPVSEVLEYQTEEPRRPGPKQPSAAASA